MYQDLRDKLDVLIKQLITENGLSYQHIDTRIKSLESFLEKAQRLNLKENNPFEKIHDIIGIRIITYYKEDVKKIARLLETQLKVNHKNGDYDSKNLPPDQFGYLSTHYKFSISDELAASKEWSQLKDIIFEIQIRTVAQHAWASLDHKLRYKTSQEIPKSIKRQIFRLSALFETADTEFSEIKRKLESKERKYLQKYKKGDLDVKLNDISPIVFGEQ